MTRPIVIGALLGVLSLIGSANAADTPSRWPGNQGNSYEALKTLPDWSGTWAFSDSDFGEMMQFAKSAPFKPGYAQAHKAQKSNPEKCLPSGMPDIMSIPLAYEFLLTPGRVTILSEEGPLIRRVYTDGRTHTADPDPTYAGESIGHWEGGTLVIDTTGITAKSEYLMATKTSGKAHVIEHIRLVDHDHLRDDIEIQDPVALTMPWRYGVTYARSNTGFIESYYCDNNRDANGEPDLEPPPPAQ